MRLISLWTYLRAALAACLVLAVCEMAAASGKPTQVELWVVGDDGYTQGLALAVERAFRSSPDFIWSSGNKPGTLVVQIPRNVNWKKIGTRVKVFYTVEFRFQTIDGRVLSSNKGSCWDDELAKCTDQIVKNAKIAALKIHQTTQ